MSERESSALLIVVLLILISASCSPSAASCSPSSAPLVWPGIWGNEGYLDGLGDAVEQGLVKAVGVSNYSEKRLRKAHAKLQERGIPLASNQVNYSLIYRAPEENGVKSTCDELGITLIAYSPIAQVFKTSPCDLKHCQVRTWEKAYLLTFLSQPL